MNTKTLWMTGALVLVMASGSMALAHGGKGPKQGPDLDAMFEHFDANKDGKVTLEEIAAERAGRFDEADTDGDGFLTTDEMLAYAQKMRAAEQTRRMEARMGRMLDRLDADEDGKLSREEAELAEGRKPRFERMFERLDADEDGAISKAELEEAAAHRKGGKRHGAPWWRNHD